MGFCYIMNTLYIQVKQFLSSCYLVLVLRERYLIPFPAKIPINPSGNSPVTDMA